MRYALLSIVALGVACGGAPKAPKPPEHDDAPEVKAHSEEAPTLLKHVEAGDAACYVTVDRGHGDEALKGDFDLCPGGAYDATPLVGQKIKIATRKDKVIAASCQGNPECKDTETVDLVVAIVPQP